VKYTSTASLEVVTNFKGLCYENRYAIVNDSRVVTNVKSGLLQGRVDVLRNLQSSQLECPQRDRYCIRMRLTIDIGLL
jgi:hypothetical protein